MNTNLRVATNKKKQKNGLDLTKQSPRSPRTRLGGFVILARAIDKCRAFLSGTFGEYEFGCELDQMLFQWKGFTSDDFKAYVADGHSDEEILQWVMFAGIPKTDAEILAWSQKTEDEDYTGDEEGRVWLEGKIKLLQLKQNATLFDYLEADDKASFKK